MKAIPRYASLFILLLGMIGIPGMNGVAQETITLESCLLDARMNHPLFNHLAHTDKIAGYGISNAKKQYLPQVSFSAQATYQSEVTKVPIEVPGFEIETLTRDQYKMTMDASQRILDGGLTKNQVLVTRAGADLQKAQTESSLYQIRSSILEAYFGVLKIDAQLRQLDATLETLEAQYKKIQAAVENGVSLPSNRDVIGVEILSVNQKRKQLVAQRFILTEQLGLLTGKDVDPDTQLEVPVQNNPITSGPIPNRRPEVQAFQQARTLIDAKQALTNAGASPVLLAFGQAGYGKPGLNFLENKFSPWYIAGLKLNWNLSAFYTKRNEAEINTLEALKLDDEEASFNRNLEARSIQYLSELENLNSLLGDDDGIIDLRHKITMRSTAQLDNGTITSSDYIRDVNAEAGARVAKDIHLIEINHLKHQIQNLYGNDDIK